MYVNVIYLRKLTPKSKELEGWGVGERGRGWDTVESTRIEPFLGENRVILDYLI